VLHPIFLVAREPNPRDQLVRAQQHLFVASVKTVVGHPARTDGGDKFKRSVVDHQRRRGIGGGRGVSDVAAERAAILRCDAAGFRRGATK